MKTIGLLGGMSWESTVPYYRLINQETGKRLGGLHSAPIVLFSVDFQPIETLQHDGRWREAGSLLADAAAKLELAGAELLILCTNTMHKVASQIEEGLSIPLLHIADATAQVIKRQELRKVGLLGTRFTMVEDFYCQRLENRHGLEVLIPDSDDRELVHRVIYDELCHGEIHRQSRREYARILENLVAAGAQGVILGCTEISLLVQPEDSAVPLFDTTRIHALAAVDLALATQPADVQDP
jgi:aspartate racemase